MSPAAPRANPAPGRGLARPRRDWHLARLGVSLAIAVAGLAGPLESQALAAGMSRATPISARAFGFGGAFTAIADDPYALYYNPAGLALQPLDSAIFGLQLVLAPNTYTPIAADGTVGAPQKAIVAPGTLPVLGYSTRLASRGVPSRLGLGVVFLHSNGGDGKWEKSTSEPAMNSLQDFLFEIVPGIAYEVSDRLAIGFGLRLGIGLFSIDMTAMPSDTNFSSFGMSAAFTTGMMIRPSPSLQLGLVYRSRMKMELNGDAQMDVGGSIHDTTIFSTQTWPQSVAVGAAFRLGPRTRLATQLDWVDWSSVRDLYMLFGNGVEQNEEMAFRDSLAIHAGGEYALTPKAVVRGGVTYETNASVARTLSRGDMPGPTRGGSLGAGYQLTSRYRLDVAAEYLRGATTEVPDNSDTYPNTWAGRRNASPGSYESSMFTLEMNVQYQF